MGNYVSCSLSVSVRKQHCRATKVIFPGGEEVRKFYEPMKAAELMLEKPNCFVVNTCSLRIGSRFSALNADEDLEMGTVYAMFSMKRVNSVVTVGDMGALLITANSASKKVSGGKVGVLPESTGSEVGSNNSENVDDRREMETETTETTKTATELKLNLEDIEEFSAPEFRHRMSMCRSRKPLLETIAEEPVWSR